VFALLRYSDGYSITDGITAIASQPTVLWQTLVKWLAEILRKGRFLGNFRVSPS
jgi:hypothetical protein